MQRLLKSAKFMTLLVDTVVSLATFFIGKYAGMRAEDLLYLIAAIQPVAMMMIGAIAYEDAAAKSAGNFRK